MISTPKVFVTGNQKFEKSALKKIEKCLKPPLSHFPLRTALSSFETTSQQFLASRVRQFHHQVGGELNS